MPVMLCYHSHVCDLKSCSCRDFYVEDYHVAGVYAREESDKFQDVHLPLPFDGGVFLPEHFQDAVHGVDQFVFLTTGKDSCGEEEDDRDIPFFCGACQSPDQGDEFKPTFRGFGTVRQECSQGINEDDAFFWHFPNIIGNYGEPSIVVGRGHVHHTVDGVLGPVPVIRDVGFAEVAFSQVQIMEMRHHFPEPGMFFCVEEFGYLLFEHLPIEGEGDVVQFGRGGCSFRYVFSFGNVAAVVHDGGLHQFNTAGSRFCKN